MKNQYKILYSLALGLLLANFNNAIVSNIGGLQTADLILPWFINTSHASFVRNKHGNNGPIAPSAYPAAYGGVITITAVNRDKLKCRLANRGNHIDFSAPGVSIFHTTAGGGCAQSTGTSMAALFVAAVLATMAEDGNGVSDDKLTLLRKVQKILALLVSIQYTVRV